jgi:hypothetical protein
MIIAPDCPTCGAQTQIVKNLISNGTYQIYFWCRVCRRRPIAGHCISHKSFTGDEIASIPILENYLAQYGEKCIVCQEFGTEYHHTAPTAIFKDLAESYPKYWLCRYHHELWHKTIKEYYQNGGK